MASEETLHNMLVFKSMWDEDFGRDGEMYVFHEEAVWKVTEKSIEEVKIGAKKGRKK